MSHATIQLHHPPNIDTTAMMQRKRLEAELFSLESQLRNFQQIRERLTAMGKDATAFYGELQARRAKLVARLRPPQIPKPDPRRSESGFRGPLLSRPLAPARFDPTTGIFGFGTSGDVQVPPATEGAKDKVGGKYPMSGDINTRPGTPPGFVEFAGDLSVGPEKIDPGQYDPTMEIPDSVSAA